MAHGLNSTIKREIECGHHNSISVINKLSGLVGNSATAAVTAASTVQPTASGTATSNSSNNNSTSGSGSASHSGAGNARMGSRRIFTPQFKLQVLESYRYDSECKGNQRATARKYGIHRRQIQKWLQSEKSLRESVANYNNQNSVKHHQFHNITHQMTVSSSATTTATSSSAIGATVGPSATATVTTTPGQSAAVNTHTMSGGAYVHNNNNPLHHHRHNQHHQPQSQPQSQPPYKTALDTARHSVALIPSPPTAVAQATVRLNPVAPTKCMNGLPLTPATIQTNTMSMLPTAYSQTPAIKPVPVLIQRQHQSLLHQHQHHHHQQLHHQHHHHQQQQQQHESVLMSSACLPDSEYSSMGAIQAHYENLHRPQAVYDYIRPYHPPQPMVVVPPPSGAPIDLSVGPRRPLQSESSGKSPSSDAKWYQLPETNNNEHEILKVKIEPTSPIASSTPNPSQAVDLTCRKRANHTPDPTTPPEKLPKTEDDPSAAPKPVKLFKPYLPDNEDPLPEIREPTLKSSDQKDAIIWSNHPAAPTSNFQSPVSDSAYTFPLGSPCSNSSLSSGISSGGSKFQSSASPVSSPQSPVTAAASTTTLLWCPKGSPVSGYDTASTYSDSSDHRFGATQTQQQHHHQQHHHQQPTHPCHPLSAFERRGASYSLDVKMEAIDSRYYHQDLTRSPDDAAPARSAFTSNRQHHEVQRWLMDQHVATARPGIAVHV